MDDTTTYSARTHCYICGTPFTARVVELLAKLDAGTDTAADMDELASLDCANNCSAAESAGQRRG